MHWIVEYSEWEVMEKKGVETKGCRQTMLLLASEKEPLTGSESEF